MNKIYWGRRNPRLRKSTAKVNIAAGRSGHFRLLRKWRQQATLVPVNRLTRQEQLVLCIVLAMLLTGWAVKTYRTAHPPKSAAQTAP